MYIKVNSTGVVHHASDFKKRRPYQEVVVDEVTGEKTDTTVYPEPVPNDPAAIVAKHGLTMADVTVYSNAEYAALAEVQSEALSTARADAIRALRKEACKRMSVHVPAFADWKIVDFMVTIAPMLNMVAAPADIQAAQAIYVYAKQRINAANNANAAQLEAYDPAQDNGWPS